MARWFINYYLDSRYPAYQTYFSLESMFKNINEEYKEAENGTYIRYNFILQNGCKITKRWFKG